MKTEIENLKIIITEASYFSRGQETSWSLPIEKLCRTQRAVPPLAVNIMKYQLILMQYRLHLFHVLSAFFCKRSQQVKVA